MAQGDPNPFAELRTELPGPMGEVGADMVETVKDWLAQICTEYLARKTGQRLSDERHSAPGEHPRYETGRLLESIAASVDIADGMVTLRVDTDVPYAYTLQNRMQRPIFWTTPSGGEDLLELFEPKALDLIAGVIERR